MTQSERRIAQVSGSSEDPSHPRVALATIGNRTPVTAVGASSASRSGSALSSYHALAGAPLLKPLGLSSRSDRLHAGLRTARTAVRDMLFFCALALAIAAPDLFAEEGPIDINTASAEVLAETLERIGKVRAEAIVAWREKNGSFATVEQLTAVPGIGESVLELNRERMTVK